MRCGLVTASPDSVDSALWLSSAPCVACAALSSSAEEQDAVDLGYQLRGKHCLGRTRGRHVPLRHEDEPVAVPRRQGQVVQDDHHGLALLCLFLKQREHAHLVFEIERAGRLVTQQDRGVLRDRAGNMNQLAFPARNLIDRFVLQMLDPHPRQRVFHDTGIGIRELLET